MFWAPKVEISPGAEPRGFHASLTSHPTVFNPWTNSENEMIYGVP